MGCCVAKDAEVKMFILQVSSQEDACSLAARMSLGMTCLAQS